MKTYLVMRSVPCHRLKLAMGVFILMHAVSVQAQTESRRIDLRVESVQIQPYAPRQENPIAAVASIRNNGSEPVKNVYISFSIRRGGKKVRTIEGIPSLADLPSLGSVQSLPVSIGDLKPGDYEIVITADPDNLISETNENNNTLSRPFRVTA